MENQTLRITGLNSSTAFCNGKLHELPQRFTAEKKFCKVDPGGGPNAQRRAQISNIPKILWESWLTSLSTTFFIIRCRHPTILPSKSWKKHHLKIRLHHPIIWVSWGEWDHAPIFWASVHSWRNSRWPCGPAQWCVSGPRRPVRSPAAPPRRSSSPSPPGWGERPWKPRRLPPPGIPWFNGLV